MEKKPIDFGKLYAVMEAHAADPALAKAAIALVRPLFDQVNGEPYALTPAANLDHAKVMAAIETLFGTRPAEIRALSLSTYLPRDHEEGLAWRARLEAEAERLERETVLIMDQLEEHALFAAIDAAVSDEMDSAVDSVIDGMSDVPPAHFLPSIPVDSDLTTVLAQAFAVAVAALIAGTMEDPKFLDQLAPFVEVMKSCLPFGTLKSEPGVWLVVCA